MLLSLYRSLRGYRGYILGSVKREFQSRYRNSLFGALWPVLNPHFVGCSWLGARTTISRSIESLMLENTP